MSPSSRPARSKLTRECRILGIILNWKAISFVSLVARKGWVGGGGGGEGGVLLNYHFAAVKEVF